jgi:hypothetical protein
MLTNDLFPWTLGHTVKTVIVEYLRVLNLEKVCLKDHKRKTLNKSLYLKNIVINVKKIMVQTKNVNDFS